MHMLFHKNQPTHSMASFLTHKCILAFSFRINFGFTALRTVLLEQSLCRVFISLFLRKGTTHGLLCVLFTGVFIVCVML